MAKQQHPEIARALGGVGACLDRWMAPQSGQPAVVLVACSGGRDSVALLGLLALLVPSRAMALAVGHIDHGLRPESPREAGLVERLAGDLGLPFRGVRLDLEGGPGLPARARDARRAALRTMAQEMGAGAIALGHTATDQAETVLMHLTRGAGLEGVAGMAVAERDPGGGTCTWLRPLLHLTRAQTGALAGHLGLDYVDDPTNLDHRHLRVRVRESLLPLLREANPGVESAFCAAAQQAREAQDALAQWAAREHTLRSTPGARTGDPHRLDLTGFGDLPRAVRTRTIRSFLSEQGVSMASLGRRLVDAVDLALIATHGTDRGHAPRAWDLHPKLRLRLDKCGLWVEPAPNH